MEDNAAVNYPLLQGSFAFPVLSWLWFVWLKPGNATRTGIFVLTGGALGVEGQWRGLGGLSSTGSFCWGRLGLGRLGRDLRVAAWIALALRVCKKRRRQICFLFVQRGILCGDGRRVSWASGEKPQLTLQPSGKKEAAGPAALGLGGWRGFPRLHQQTGGRTGNGNLTSLFLVLLFNCCRVFPSDLFLIV